MAAPSGSAAPFALLLHGLLGTLKASPSIALDASLGRGAHKHKNGTGARRPQLSTRPEDFVGSVAACAASQVHHIVRANAHRGGVDVFAHSWNRPIGAFIDHCYGAHLRGSLHEELQFNSTQEKARSQSLSVSRAFDLMRQHEHARGRAYTLCLVLRSDLLVGGPIDLAALDPAHIWFSEHCCLNTAVDESERMLVRKTCQGWRGPRGIERANASRPNYYARRVLGPCRISTTIGGAPSRQLADSDDMGYFVMDWWFAARPAVVESWHEISERWGWYRRRLAALRVYIWLSHAVWTIHIHDVLNASSAVRFAVLRLNTVRTSYARLKMEPGRRIPLGPYVTDAVGDCPTLTTLDNRTLSRTAMLAADLPPTPNSEPARLLGSRMATMARSCQAASLPANERVVCCGEPLDGRSCGEQTCSNGMDSESNEAEVRRRFWRAGEDAVRVFRGLGKR